MAVNYYYFSLVLCFFVSSLMWKWKTRLHFCLRENSVTGTQVKLINKVVLSNKCKIQRWTDQQNLTFWNERLSIKSSSKYPSPQNLFFKNFSRWCFNQRNLLSCSSLGNISHNLVTICYLTCLKSCPHWRMTQVPGTCWFFDFHVQK